MQLQSFAALPPHSAERLCLSGAGIYYYEALPHETEAQPPDNLEINSKAEPYRTVWRQSRKAEPPIC
jgi:hypothetical protein